MTEMRVVRLYLAGREEPFLVPVKEGTTLPTYGFYTFPALPGGDVLTVNMANVEVIVWERRDEE
jgi:hypothetical protein